MGDPNRKFVLQAERKQSCPNLAVLLATTLLISTPIDAAPRSAQAKIHLWPIRHQPGQRRNLSNMNSEWTAQSRCGNVMKD